MKTKVTLIAALLFCASKLFCQVEIDSTLLNFIAGVDSTYIYTKDGEKEWFYVQKDVYCYQLYGDIEDTSTYGGEIDELEYWNTARSKFNEVHFNSGSTWLERAEFVEYITELPNYKWSSFALTKNSGSDYTSKEFYRSDDQLLITFNDPNLSATAIDSFASDYGLQLVHSPQASLPNSVSWTYTFRLSNQHEWQEGDMVSIMLAQIIYENEPELVKLAEPNLYATYMHGCTPTTEVGDIVAGINGTWHIRNTGDVVWSGYDGVNDADADICECWGEGYTGSGVKVGVVDFGGIEFDHDDFESSNLNVVYRATDMTEHTSNVYVNDLVGHGMNVTGVIGATPNNDDLGQRYAVGAAYGAEVIPAIVATFAEAGTAASNAQIVESIMYLLSKNIDVINMSFKTDGGIGSIGITIDNGTTAGRTIGGVSYGTVFVASVGNTDGVYSNFPANMPNVIGVGWTNPEDYRSAYDAPGDGYGWTVGSGEGSTYGDPSFNYDVVAPGELIWTTDIETTPGAYIPQKGSSFASPIVASIAAMMLDKNPLVSHEDIKKWIRNGAEKVHTDTYNYYDYGDYAPGYNDEMFYGRVSCIKSLNLVVGIDEFEEINLTVFSQGNGQYRILLPTEDNLTSFDIFDLSGRLIQTQNITTNSSELIIDLSNYSKGMYVLNIKGNNKKIASVKLMR